MSRSKQQKQQNETIGGRIRRLMTARGLNQTTLAKRAGLDRTDLNRVVNDRRDPRYDELVWICQVLETRIEELLDGVELPDNLAKALAKVEEVARRVLAAEGERDEIAARLAAAARSFDEERALRDVECEGLRRQVEQLTTELTAARGAAQEQEREALHNPLQHQVEQLTAELVAARGAAQEASRLRASMELSLSAGQASWKAERTQLVAACQKADATIRQLQTAHQQAEAANGQLRAQIANLQAQLTHQEGQSVIAGLLGALGGGLLGAMGGAAAASPSQDQLLAQYRRR